MPNHLLLIRGSLVLPLLSHLLCLRALLNNTSATQPCIHHRADNSDATSSTPIPGWLKVVRQNAEAAAKLQKPDLEAVPAAGALPWRGEPAFSAPPAVNVAPEPKASAKVLPVSAATTAAATTNRGPTDRHRRSRSPPRVNDRRPPRSRSPPPRIPPRSKALDERNDEMVILLCAPEQRCSCAPSTTCGFQR